MRTCKLAEDPVTQMEKPQERPLPKVSSFQVLWLPDRPGNTTQSVPSLLPQCLPGEASGAVGEDFLREAVQNFNLLASWCYPKTNFEIGLRTFNIAKDPPDTKRQISLPRVERENNWSLRITTKNRKTKSEHFRKKEQYVMRSVISIRQHDLSFHYDKQWCILGDVSPHLKVHSG